MKVLNFSEVQKFYVPTTDNYSNNNNNNNNDNDNNNNIIIIIITFLQSGIYTMSITSDFPFF